MLVGSTLKRTLFISLVLLLAATASGCTGQSQQTTATVDLADFKIIQKGVLDAGKGVTLTVSNTGQVQHELAIAIGSDTRRSGPVDPGKSTTMYLPALDAGAYTMWCTVPGHRQSGMQADLAVGGPPTKSVSAREMEAMDRATTASFPAKTAGRGAQPITPTIVDGVQHYNLNVSPVRWEVSPGQFIDAYAYNGQIPGPTFRVHHGDRISVIVHNNLPESTTVHFHGLTLPNAMDGVPFITQDPIEPGHSFTYSFTVKDPPGSYFYHSHENALEQVGKGLYGAFIIEPAQPTWDQEEIVALQDGPLGYTINGKGFPATAPIVTKLGTKVLLRFMNAGQLLHPMHLHGFHFTVVAEDGRPVPAPYAVDTLVIPPGERYDATFVADNPGTWAFHCHILSHAESDKGMFGMVTAVVVK